MLKFRDKRLLHKITKLFYIHRYTHESNIFIPEILKVAEKYVFLRHMYIIVISHRDFCNLNSGSIWFFFCDIPTHCGFILGASGDNLVKQKDYIY